MMTESSLLVPHMISLQCHAGIRNLEANNTALVNANNAMNRFINETRLAGRGYDALKQQIQDYRLISDAKREANDSDIWDFGALRTAVGDGSDLCGGHILSGIRQAEADELRNRGHVINHERAAEGYRLTGGTTCPHYLYHRRQRNNYESLRQGNINTKNALTELKTRYETIEATTKWLFERSDLLRNQIESGFGVIAGASTGLPDSYDSQSLAAWRLRMQELRERLPFDQALDEIRVEHGDEAYEWVKESYDIAREMLNAWGFPVGDFDFDLLSEKLHDYQMIQEIKRVTEEQFPLSDWEALTTLEERQIFLQEYMDAILPIMGLENIGLRPISFDPTIGQANWNGFYNHSFNHELGIPARTTWINPTTIDPNNEGWWFWQSSPKDSYESLQTLVHELRHAYQNVAADNIRATENAPNAPVVASVTADAWDHNRRNYLNTRTDRKTDERDTERYQEPGQTGNYTYKEYRNQPLEVDANGFARNEVWNKV